MSLPQPRGMFHPSNLRFFAIAVMIVGAVLSLAAAFGEVWLVRAGVAVAVIAGVGAVVSLIVAMARAADSHTSDVREVRDFAIATLKEEREREREVLKTIDLRTIALQDRIKDLREQLIVAEDDLVKTKEELTSVEIRLDSASTTLIEYEELINRHEETISKLTAQVVEFETELAELKGAKEEQGAELLTLPRRVDRSLPEISEAI